MTTARMMHGAYLTDAIENLPEDQRPKTAAEAMALFQQLNRDFLQQTGMSGADRRRLARELTMIQNTQNAMATVVSGSIKAEREANLNQAEADIANMIPGLANGTVTPEELLRFATERFAFGNVGYNGRSQEANRAAALEVMKQLAAQGRVSDIEAMEGVELVPGNKGTTVRALMGDEVDRLIETAEQQALQDHNRSKGLKTLEIKESLQFYYDDPTPANRAQAIEILRGIGTEAALKKPP